MGLFKNIFSKSSRSKVPADLSVLNCDVHSHFIPAIDDGSISIENSVEMIKEFYNLGYKKIITTPHIMSDFYRNTPETILNGLENVRTALKNEGVSVQLEAAAEYYLDADFEKKIEEQKLLTFGKNYLLFEVSYMNAPDNLDRVIFKLMTSGYKPVLAHPERYPFWYNHFEKYEELKDKGTLHEII